ncbi:MAG: ISAzo13-like element transposase-related protein [Acidimicrobiales bacterium]
MGGQRRRAETKKKELIGDYGNGGAECAPAGEPERTQVHDFVDPAGGQGHALWHLRPGQQRGWVSVATWPTPPSSPESQSAAGGTRWAGHDSPMRTGS